MKSRFVYIVILLIVAASFVYSMTRKESDKDKEFSESEKGTAIIPVEKKSSCSKKEPNQFLAGAQYPELQKLDQLQKLCDSFVAESMMVFSIFPTTDDEIESSANYLAATINEYELFGITPLILIEPVNTQQLIPIKDIVQGDYDEQLQKLFSSVKQLRNSEKSVIWVPYPEINTPSWDRKDFRVDQYVDIIENFRKVVSEYFPDDRLGVLLNSQSYPVWDEDWSRGDYISMNPYLDGFEKGSVDLLIVQGFPWIPPANEASDNKITDPFGFFNESHIISAAKKLGIQNVWLNTGTFSGIHLGQEENKVQQTFQEREKILDGVIEIADQIKQQQLNVTIHLFAKDKSNEKEATNWSYTNSQQELNLLKNFITKVYEKDFLFAIYDK